MGPEEQNQSHNIIFAVAVIAGSNSISGATALHIMGISLKTAKSLYSERFRILQVFFLFSAARRKTLMPWAPTAEPAEIAKDIVRASESIGHESEAILLCH